MNAKIFTFGLVAGRPMVVGGILVQTKLKGMLESLGEEDKKRKAIDICQPNLPLDSSVLFCSWIETISGYLPWANSKQLQKCVSTKCFHLGKVKIPWNAPLEGRGTFAIQLGNSHKTYSHLSAAIISSLRQVAFTEDSTFRGTGAQVTPSVVRQ